jgi:hypothetical protein
MGDGHDRVDGIVDMIAFVVDALEEEPRRRGGVTGRAVGLC